VLRVSAHQLCEGVFVAALVGQCNAGVVARCTIMLESKSQPALRAPIGKKAGRPSELAPPTAPRVFADGDDIVSLSLPMRNASNTM